MAYPHWQTRMYPAAVPNPTVEAGMRNVASTAGTSLASLWPVGGWTPTRVLGFGLWFVIVGSSKLSRIP